MRATQHRDSGRWPLLAGARPRQAMDHHHLEHCCVPSWGWARCEGLPLPPAHTPLPPAPASGVARATLSCGRSFCCSTHWLSPIAHISGLPSTVYLTRSSLLLLPACLFTLGGAPGSRARGVLLHTVSSVPTAMSAHSRCALNSTGLSEWDPSGGRQQGSASLFPALWRPAQCRAHRRPTGRGAELKEGDRDLNVGPTDVQRKLKGEAQSLPLAWGMARGRGKQT